jgi:hypothetical protein
MVNSLIMNVSKGIDDDEEVFGYQVLSISVIMFSSLILLFVFFSIKIYGEYGYRDAFIFFIVCVPFFFGLAFLTLLDRSDVVVNVDGVARSLFGWTWRSILWSDIEIIRVSEMPVLTAQKTRVFYKIIPARPGSKKMRSIVIGKDLDMAGRFITLMNVYIASHKIPVGILVNGVPTRTDHL